MSQLEVDKIIPQSGTTLTIGDSGDTISFADGATLAIDTNTLAIDSTNNRVGIGTTSPSYPLVVSGGGSLSNNDTSIGLDISGTNHIRQRITTPTSGGYQASLALESNSNEVVISTAGSNEIRFTTNASEAMRIDSSGNVGIGNTTPSSFVESSRFVVGSGTSGVNEMMFLYSGTNTFGALGFADGTSSTDRYRGMIGYDHSTDAMFISTAGGGSASRDVTIDSSGNVGIGTSSPSKELHVYASSGESAIQVETAGTDAGLNLIAERASASFINFGDQDSTNVGQIYYPHSGNYMHFKTNGAERMRIDSSGRVGIGTTSMSANFEVSTAGNFNTQTSVIIKNTDTSPFGGEYIVFQDGNGTAGSISSGGSGSVAYNTSSDYRLKENVVEMTGATDRLKQLSPKRFNFIADANKTVDGFLAHEVQSIVPEAISGEKDEVDEEGNPVYQGIDQSKLVPLLTASLKEAINKIEQLEARISALET